MIYSISFILSYLVSFVLIFDSNLFKTKSFILKNYLRYFIIFLITMPFVIKISNRISLLSLFLSPILSVFISYTIIPLSFLLSVVPILDYIFRYVFIFINYYINTLASYSIFINIKTAFIISFFAIILINE